MPWPSLEVASRISDAANVFFIGSLVVGVVSTVVIVWMASVKEGYWAEARQESEERIAGLNKETARLSAEAEASRAAIADATARALEAKLELEKFKAPRELSPEQSARILGKIKAFSDISFDSATFEDKESLALVNSIAEMLGEANWKEIPWIGTDFVIARPGKPVIGVAIESGISIQFAQGSTLGDAARALAAALTAEGIEARAEFSPPAQTTINNSAIHVVVGHKR